ncbi:hypothetical protein CKJ79_17810 [Vibrio coralliilyticus]|nr:hypothetical protein CKJ79_17810 [Vibrio coralliilyticus]
MDEYWTVKRYFCNFFKMSLANVMPISIMPPCRQGKGSQGFQAKSIGQKENEINLKKVFDTSVYLARMAASSEVM